MAMDYYIASDDGGKNFTIYDKDKNEIKKVTKEELRQLLVKSGYTAFKHADHADSNFFDKWDKITGKGKYWKYWKKNPMVQVNLKVLDEALKKVIRKEIRLLTEQTNALVDGLNYIISFSKEASNDDVLRLQFLPKTNAEYDKIMDTGKADVAKTIEKYIYNKLKINAKHAPKMDTDYGGLNFEFKLEDLLKQYFK